MEQQTNIIRADDKSIREMLDKTKYIVDFSKGNIDGKGNI